MLAPKSNSLFVNFFLLQNILLITTLTKERLIAVTKASLRGSSLRITLPKEIAEILNVGEKDHIGFYESNGEVIVRRIK